MHTPPCVAKKKKKKFKQTQKQKRIKQEVNMAVNTPFHPPYHGGSAVNTYMHIWSAQNFHFNYKNCHAFIRLGFPDGSDDKVSVYNAGDTGSIPGLGRSPGEGNGSLLKYSCLENPIHKGACNIYVKLKTNGSCK